MSSKRSTKKTTILLGYEAGTGEPVYIPLHHAVVTGQTRLSGKTTTLEGIISRGEMTSIAFLTKRGEKNFHLPNVHEHQPYFRPRADWQYVESLLRATMQEGMKFERSWIIDACKGARSLRDVRDNINAELDAGARGLNKSVLTNLRAYLDLVLPELEATPFAHELQLKPGLNVMNLVGLRTEVQSLVIASTLEAIHETGSELLVVLPEAWRFIPQGSKTPVSRVLEPIVRQGATVDVYVLLDSQDITGIDKVILKSMGTWIIGRQAEKNEVERAIKQIPLPKTKLPKAEEVMRLRLGHFIVATPDDPVRTVYVKPHWLPEDVAIRIAKTGDVDAARLFAPDSPTKEEDPDLSYKQKYLDTQEANRKLQARIKELEAKPPEPPAKPAPAKQAKEKPAAKGSAKPAKGERVVYDVDVDVGVPHLTVRERVVHVQATSDDNKGRAAILIAEGFFDEARTVNAARTEFRSRGWGAWTGGSGATNMTRLLADFAEMGFLRREEKAFVVVPEAKDRINRVQEREER